MLEYQQNEQIAERRRWMLHLVDSGDGITPETGVTGQGKISKNGGEPDDTTNSLVEVDSTEMPGFYYIELTAGELDTLGFIGLRFKTAATAEFQDRALVSYNDPFASQGGFSGGGSSKGFTAKQAQDIAERVWQVKLENKTAQEVLLAKSEFDPAKDKVLVDLTSLETAHSKVLEALTGLQGSLEFETVLEAIKAIKEPKDYDQAINALGTSLSTLDTKLSGINLDVTSFVKTLSDFQPKMKLTQEEVSGSLKQISEIQQGFTGLQKLVDEFKESLDQQTDMDKRFAAMKTVMDKNELSTLADKFTKLQTTFTEEMRKLTLKMMEQRIIILDELKK